MLWLLTLTALADPWDLPVKEAPAGTASATAEAANVPEAKAEAETPELALPPELARSNMPEIRSVPPAGLLYRTDPQFTYPSHRATPAPVECRADIVWASDGSVERVFTPLSSFCPISFAQATSAGFKKAAIEPFTPPERVHTEFPVRMVLQGSPAPRVQDIYALSVPLDADIDHCGLIVELSPRSGAASVQSTNRERCSFEPRGRMKANKALLKSLEAEEVCEARATAEDWRLTEVTFTNCADGLRAEATRLMSDWVVVQSPSPKHIYDIRIVFPGPL